MDSNQVKKSKKSKHKKNDEELSESKNQNFKKDIKVNKIEQSNNVIESNKKSSMKRKCDDGTNNANELSEEIKSANSWEDVDLGSEDRKLKFLKLMGAANTKSQGKFHIGQLNIEKHTQAGKNLSNLDDTMLKQFEYGIDRRLSHGHQGIGSKYVEPSTSKDTCDDNLVKNKFKMNFVKENNS